MIKERTLILFGVACCLIGIGIGHITKKQQQFTGCTDVIVLRNGKDIVADKVFCKNGEADIYWQNPSPEKIDPANMVSYKK